MKIGIISIEYPPILGGVGHAVRRIAQGLSKFNIEVNVIVLPSTLDTSLDLYLSRHQYSKDGKVEVYQLYPAKRRKKVAQKTRDVECFEWLCNFINEKKLDLVHSFYVSHSGFVAGLAAHECGLPFIASIRGNDLHQNLFDPLQFSYIRWALENADMLTFVCNSLERRAHELSNFKNPSRVIWNSVDPNEFDLKASLSQNCLNLTKPVVTSAGRFRQKKGIERLIESCSMIQRQMTLLLLGDFDWLERDYWLQIVLPSIPSHIHLVVTGEVAHSQILTYYHLADIVVFPSIHDGCPNSMLEAMLASRPIICTDAGAMAEIIEASQGGIIVDPYTPQKLSEKIQYLLDNSEFSCQLGQKGHSFVLEHLSPEKETNLWIECYQNVKIGGA